MNQEYRRSEMRLAVYGAGSLSWEDAAAGPRSSRVIVRNVSGLGVQVICGRPVRTGAAVFLTGDAYECLGEVRYCVHGEDGYRIGIELKREPYRRTPPVSAPV